MSPGEALVREWALHLFHMAFQGSVVAAILVPAATAMRRWSPAVRSALLSIALAKFVLPPMLPFPTGVFSRFDAAPHAFFSRFGSAACAAIAGLHLAGFAASLIRLAAARRRTRRWLRGSAAWNSAAAPDVRTSADVPVPCAVGGRRPAILLPDRIASTLPAEELDAVIRHERVHLAHRDPAATAFESIVAAFWWFHPAVRSLIARRREIREERCDDAVLRRVPRDVYRRALLGAAALAGPRLPAAGVPATGPAAALARRIRRIADPRPAGRCARLAAVVAVAAAAVLLVPGVRPSAGHAFPVERASR